MPTHKNSVIIIGPAFPLRGGIANFNEALCRAFTDSGVDCSIVSFTVQYPAFLFPGKTQLAEGDNVPENIKIVTLVNSVNPFSWIRTASYIRKQKPSLVIIRYWLPFMGPCLGTIARMIKRNNSGIKVTALADNIIPHESRPGDKAFTNYFVKACDAFVVMSQSVLNDLQTFESMKPAVLKYHPVYDIFGAEVSKVDARKNLGLKENEKYVLFFGFIRKYKGLDLLLKAFADKRVKDLNVKLIVAGEFYEDKQPYHDLINELGIGNNVILHDHYIPKVSVKNYFGSADLVAQTYRDATQSGVTQIAYHFNKPMLVTNVGGLPEMVPHNVAGYVTETNAGSIAAAIADFYENRREAAFIAGVKQNAKNFSWGKFIEAFT